MLLLQQSQMCSQISEELNISAERVSHETIFSLDTRIVVIIVQHQQSIELNRAACAELVFQSVHLQPSK